jgi:hypothetical protein
MTAEIVYPTLDEYAARVDALAKKYGRDFWWQLSLEQMDDEDRFEFSFIKECLWDDLIRHECEVGSVDIGEPPGQALLFSTQDKPGSSPGLSFCMEVLFERPRVRRPHSSLYR